MGARRALQPGRAACTDAYAATAVLPEPTSPWSRRSIGAGRVISARMSRIAHPGRRQRDGPVELPAERTLEGAAQLGVDHVADLDGPCQIAPPLPPPPDHAELEGERLVEGQSIEGASRHQVA